MSEELSVIMCARNEERHIAGAVKSLQLAAHPEWELIIVDDSSTDRTGAVIEQFRKKLPNIRTHRFDVNMGQGIARNFGLMLAKGEYLAFLDADDYVHADKLQTHVALARTKNVDILAGGHRRIYDVGEKSCPAPEGEYPGRVAAALYLAREFASWGSCFHLFKRGHILRNACFFTPHFYYEDVVFCVNAFYKASNVLSLKEGFYVYRCNNQSTTRINTNSQLHLLSSARLYFDIAQFINTVSNAGLYSAAFNKICEILVNEHFPKMLPVLKYGGNLRDPEFYNTFISYINCKKSLFSDSVLHVVSSQCTKNDDVLKQIERVSA
ncbi:MAG: glycosyltransferase family 2 protein [Desulfovibrio sp.]|jgi:glycosyltransferase involved in cell wall biosynthesis|nr:glycosyltransferase family 2 protein [Desulfovibrio sp.]